MGTWALEDLHVPMTRYSKSYKRLVNEAMKRIAEDGINTMIDASPYDTGHLVNNWHFSIGAPSNAVKGAYVPGSVSSYPGRVSLRNYQGGVIYINNNVRYVGYVDGGSPTTRPHNMIRKGVNAMLARCKQIQVIKQQ